MRRWWAILRGLRIYLQVLYEDWRRGRHVCFYRSLSSRVVEAETSENTITRLIQSKCIRCGRIQNQKSIQLLNDADDEVRP
jgi:hypothetical protein